MVQANIYFTDEEDSIIELLSKEFSLSKHETVKKIIREYFIERRQQ